MDWIAGEVIPYQRGRKETGKPILGTATDQGKVIEWVAFP